MPPGINRPLLSMDAGGDSAVWSPKPPGCKVSVQQCHAHADVGAQGVLGRLHSCSCSSIHERQSAGRNLSGSSAGKAHRSQIARTITSPLETASPCHCTPREDQHDENCRPCWPGRELHRNHRPLQILDESRPSQTRLAKNVTARRARHPTRHQKLWKGHWRTTPQQ